MAEENDPIPTNEGASAETAVEVTDTKKKRAPRRSKEVLEALAAQKAASAKSRKAPVKKGPATEATSSKFAAGLTKTSPSGISKATPAVTPAVSIDAEFDLVQLEEENKRLRTALAEKLRAENIDLRKRLGQD